MSSELNSVPSQARTHLNDNQGQLALQQEEETLADPIRRMPGLEGSTSPESPAGNSCQPRAVMAGKDKHVACRGSGRGEDLDTLKAKRGGLLPTWRCSEGKAGFSQGVSLF